MNPNEQQPTTEAPVPMPTPTTSTQSSTPAAAEGNNSMVMGILAYLGILVIIPLLVAKDDAFVKFHVKQGLVLCVGWVALWFIGSMSYGLMFGMLAPIISLINLAIIVLSIIGIINVVKKAEKELPLVGSLAKHLPI